MLKLTNLFFALSLILFLGACNSDDESSNAGDLVGTWTAVSFDADIMTTSSFNGTDFTSTTVAVGSAFNYDLIFTETAFTTSGGYTMETNTEVNGSQQSSSTDAYTNVSGSGTYTASGDELTISGSFFNFEVDGMPVQGQGDPQTVMYEINSDDELIVTQNETMTSTSGGATVTSMVVSSSTWTRQ